jgi:hypothetical protein
MIKLEILGIKDQNEAIMGKIAQREALKETQSRNLKIEVIQ